MRIFSKPEQPVVVVSATNLKQLSVNALGTFQKVLQELRSINESATNRQAVLASEADRITLEITELDSINTDNNKVIRNIERIIA